MTAPPNSISEQLKTDLKVAIRSNDTVAKNVIRYTQAAMKNNEIELKRPLNEDESIAVIRKQIKQRQDSIELYKQGGREDLAATEQAEIDVLQKYLPAEMSDEELQLIVTETADEVGASGLADMKLLMPALIIRVQGKADGRRLSMLATEELKRRA